MNPASAKFVQVVIASPLRQHFDYLPASGQSAKDYIVGARVSVPFGRRQMTGIVIGHSAETGIAANKLKQIASQLDSSAILDEDLLKLADWMSQYYHHPYGDTVLSLLPGQLRKGGKVDAYSRNCWQISHHGLGLPADALSRAPKQQALLNDLRQAEQDRPGKTTTETELLSAGHTRSIALQLEKKRLAIASEQAYYPSDCQSLLNSHKATGENDKRDTHSALRSEQNNDQNQSVSLTSQKDTRPTLNDEQDQAVSLITSSLNSFATILLEGITGSGKTEVYLRAIDQVLALNQQALVLVPEIGLTPQTINRFVDRFPIPIAIFHSGLNDRERLAAWTAAKEGYARIIIGTRSAVFTPMANPGLIIIDEEHDGSYKQQDSLRYSARDVAIIRARAHKIPTLLGSATPALETLLNTQQGKFRHSQLRQRAGDAQPPTIELLDIRRKELHEGLSDDAIAAIATTLSCGQQAMVFVNRRGFAPLLMCHDCGWHALCDHCDARLTLHHIKSNKHMSANHTATKHKELRCHHCDFRAAPPSSCQRCQSKQLSHVGQGTQRSAEALAALFPLYPVIRIDRDTTQGKQAMGKQIDIINRGDPAILVGTQMLAKGHHFPALDLVVVLDTDQGLYNPDFRGPEKTIQLLTQVAGRAGRSTQLGKVIIQTHLPEHPLLQTWQAEGYQGTIESLLTERSLRALPPYWHMAIVRADSQKPDEPMRFLTAMAQQLQHLSGSYLNTAHNCQMIGPLPAVMEKRAGRHRAQITLKSAQRKPLHKLIDQLIPLLEQSKKTNGLRWSIDIDPQEVI